MEKDPEKIYDNISKNELRKRLKREPTVTELANSDTDADLVNETMWQMMRDFHDRLVAIEEKMKEHGII